MVVGLSQGLLLVMSPWMQEEVEQWLRGCCWFCFFNWHDAVSRSDWNFGGRSPSDPASQRRSSSCRRLREDIRRHWLAMLAPAFPNIFTYGPMCNTHSHVDIVDTLLLVCRGPVTCFFRPSARHACLAGNITPGR